MIKFTVEDFDLILAFLNYKDVCDLDHVNDVRRKIENLKNKTIKRNKRLARNVLPK